LKGQIKDFQARFAHAESQLRDAQNEKVAMMRNSQTNQTKLSDIVSQIADKRAQQERMNALIETLSREIQAKTEEMQNATSDLQTTERRLDKLRSEMQSYRQIQDDRVVLVERLRRTPLRSVQIGNRPTVAVQCNLVPKKKQRGMTGGSFGDSAIDGQAQLAQTKSDMAAIQTTLAAGHAEVPQTADSSAIVINNFEDLAQVRETIMQNNAMFDFSVNSIIRAQKGLFTIERANGDETRVFAEWVMRRIMRNATASRSVTIASVQTEKVESMMDEVKPVEAVEDTQTKTLAMEKPSNPMVAVIRNSRFVKLLDSDYSERPPRTFEWLIHAIRQIFDEKTVDDRTNVREGTPISALPEYILVWAFRQFGRPDLIQKGCWDLFLSSHHYMHRCLEVNIFVRFLDEHLTTEQLTFFLNSRSWLLLRCVSLPIQHSDFNVYFTETYLTTVQVEDYFHHTFPQTEQELLEDLTLRGWSSADPDRFRENDPANIPVMRILELAIGEEQDRRVRRLRTMLAFYRPIPRMTLKRFVAFLRSMISNIDPNVVDSLYRSSLVYNTIRVDMDQGAFSDYFARSEKAIVPSDWIKDAISPDEFADLSPLYANVLNRWKQFSPFLTRMLKNLTPDRFEGVKALVSEIRYQLFQMIEARVAFDGVLFYQTYHRLLQTVMQACLRLKLPDAMSFTKQVQDFHRLLMKKLQAAQAVRETAGEGDG
jgi:hypothetical protein